MVSTCLKVSTKVMVLTCVMVSTCLEVLTHDILLTCPMVLTCLKEAKCAWRLQSWPKSHCYKLRSSTFLYNSISSSLWWWSRGFLLLFARGKHQEWDKWHKWRWKSYHTHIKNNSNIFLQKAFVFCFFCWASARSMHLCLHSPPIPISPFEAAHLRYFATKQNVQYKKILHCLFLQPYCKVMGDFRKASHGICPCRAYLEP